MAVIGGGDTALDAARTARRLGAREVHILYRRTAALMPAMAAEVAEAQREGVQFHFLTLPFRILGDGRVQGADVPKSRTGGTGCPRAAPRRSGSRIRAYLGGGYGHHRGGSDRGFPVLRPRAGVRYLLQGEAGRRPGLPGHPHPRRLCRRRPDHRPRHRGGRLCRGPPGRPGHRWLTCKAGNCRRSCRP